MKLNGFVLTFATLLTLAVPVLAQSQEVPPPAPLQTRTEQVPVQPSVGTEPVIPTARERHGFYLRFNSNTGFSAIGGDGPRGPATITGLGTGVLVAVGGTVARGVVLAGMIQATNVMARFNGGPYDKVQLTLGTRTISASPKVDAVVSQLGALIDWYPNPSLGWHVGVSGGWSIMSLVNRADESMYYGAAVGGVFFGGYDWFMTRDWSMGFSVFGSGSTTARLQESEHGADTGYRLHSLSIGVAGSLLCF